MSLNELKELQSKLKWQLSSLECDYRWLKSYYSDFDGYSDAQSRFYNEFIFGEDEGLYSLHHTTLAQSIKENRSDRNRIAALLKLVKKQIKYASN